MYILEVFQIEIMAPEVKSRNAKTKRLSGQTLRLRKKRWPLTGLKADKKYVGESFYKTLFFFTLVMGQFAALYPFFPKEKHPVYFFTLEGLTVIYFTEQRVRMA